MTARCPDAAWAAVREIDPGELERDALGRFVADVATVRAWLDAAEVSAARRSRQLADEGRSEPAEHLLGRSGRRSGREAKAAAERERVCGRMPDLESALSTGEISAGHIDAVANATRSLDDEVQAMFADHVDHLVGRASRVGVDRFARACRELARRLAAEHRARSEVDELEQQRAAANVRRWVDKSSGMHHTHLELDPVRDHQVWSAIDAQLRRLRAVDGNRETPFAQLQADAVVAMATHGAAIPRDADDAPPSSGVDRVPEITVLVDHRRLADDAVTAGVCETDGGTPLPVDTVRRLCCDAEVLPVVLGGDRQVLDEGRSRRTVSRSQRRALRAMHRTCAHPDCGVGFPDCRIHHVRWWTRDRGPSDIDNLLPLCERHHRLVHEGGWALTMTPDRVATWRRPDGTEFHTGSTIDRRPDELGDAPSGRHDHDRDGSGRARQARGGHDRDGDDRDGDDRDGGDRDGQGRDDGNRARAPSG